MNQSDGMRRKMGVEDYAYRHWIANGKGGKSDDFVTARELSPEQHLLMQAALQPYVDSAISKTINVAADIPFEEFCGVYEQADSLRLKGCTTFRPNPVTEAVLIDESDTCATCPT